MNQAKNRPETSYQRDGFMRTDDGGGSGPNYWPNSFGGPGPDADAKQPPQHLEGEADHHSYVHENDDFAQPGALYSKVMSDEDREHLVGNIVDHLGGAQKRIQLRQTALFYKAHEEYGTRVAKGLGLDVAEVQRLAAMSDEERAEATAK